MNKSRSLVWMLYLVLPLIAAAAHAQPLAVQATEPQASTPAPAGGAPAVDWHPYPHEHTIDGITFEIHQPQIAQWSGDQLTGQAVMSVTTGWQAGADGKQEPTQDYGVVGFSARTQIDKDAGLVILTDLRVTQASFPTATDKQQQYTELAKKMLQSRHTLAIPLAQLEAAVAIASASQPAKSVAVNNDPPDILFSTNPAVLILVDGQPALKPSSVSRVQRVINSRSLLLQKGGRYYTMIAGHWASAPALNGPWTPLAKPDASLVQAAKQAADSHLVETLDNPPKALQDVFAAGGWPKVYVRTRPAELIAVEGEPQFAAIPGTQLSYVTNTGADVFIDGGASNAWYVVVSGRWFTADSTHGPWAYVAPDQLPADFRRIPADSPKSAVLASIPGTPQARESLIANSIPQTATVNRDKATLNVTYDGTPDFAAIQGTSLQYARNTPVPVIRVSANGYYAVDQGVWFTATAPMGPWQVATSVPAVIYTIPATSPLHYVTYVYVYGHQGDVVYTGYTPGYYGTVVTNNVVVYGTGYPCRSWVGAYWYGCPATYGMGVYFGWSPWVGWTFGMGWGWYAGWYGPYSPWWGPWHGPVYPYGWWGGGAAAWNVYGHWGNATVQGRAAAWANPWTGNYGRAARGGYYNEATGARGVGRGAVNTNIYTGTTRAAAQSARYNPETGRAVAGGHAAAVNPYTGQAAAAGNRYSYNTNTGRATHTAGAAAAGPEGAAGIGGFNTAGNGGDAKGVGGFKYDADTGSLQHGGVAKVNDNVYAGKDGNVYKYDDGQWNQVTRPDSSNNLSGQTRQTPSNLDQDRMARQGGDQRMMNERASQDYSRGGSYSRGDSFSRQSGFRSSFGGGMRVGGGFRGRR